MAFSLLSIGKLAPILGSTKDLSADFWPRSNVVGTLSYSDNAVIGVGTGKSLCISSAHVNFLLLTVADR